MINKKFFFGFLVIGSITLAQEIPPATTVQTKAPLSPTAKAFKLKAELRSAMNSFSEKAPVAQFRLRLDPSIAFGDWTVGIRQDIKDKYTKGEDNYTLENTRTFAGRNYKAEEWQIQARVEAWLPTNVRERDQLSYQGSPGTAVKVKRKWLNVTSNYETNARKMVYGTTKSAYADWMVFNELKNEIKIAKSVVGNLNVKFDDTWDQQGKRSQKYSMEQSLGINVTAHLDLEVGHFIEKSILAGGKTDSFVGYDKDLSQLYTQINYVY